MAEKLSCLVAEKDDGMRLDKWFKQYYPALTQGELQKLLRKKFIRLDGKKAEANSRIEKGQEIILPPFINDKMESQPKDKSTYKMSAKDIEEIRACVIYKDKDVIIINKPYNLAVQGGSGITKHVDGMLEALRFDEPEVPKLVHRLDRHTSGVLVLARNTKAAAKLAEAFKLHTTQKIYWAVVLGEVKEQSGTINAPLAKLGGAGAEKMVIDDYDGKNAITEFRVIDNLGKKLTWLELKPLTGRTHQLRVHCQCIGNPILGDGKYGAKEEFMGDNVKSRKLHLHARKIIIPHPTQNKMIEVEAELPAHIKETFAFCGFHEK